MPWGILWEAWRNTPDWQIVIPCIRAVLSGTIIDQALIKKDGEKRGLGYGGDFTDRPTDYKFCGNGIVYGNRTASPKAAEAKALYQNLKLTPDWGRFL